MAQEEQAVRSTGKVSWFSDGKGYGFITPDDGGEELLVHQSSILADGFRSLNVGESVEFVIAQGNGGKTKAVDVTAPGGGPFKKQDKNSGGRRFGAGGSGCYKCGEVGHLARECDNSGVEKGRDEGCFQCGEAGHFARDCRKNSSEISGGGGGGSCYTCGGYGHMARNCTSRRPTGAGRGGACHECGETGHFARDCERRGGGGGGSNKCFSCGKLGHFARECGVVS